MSVEELKEAALSLSPEARGYLARELLASLDAVSDAEAEELWIDEAIRRDNNLDSGASSTSSLDEALARARTRRR